MKRKTILAPENPTGGGPPSGRASLLPEDNGILRASTMTAPALGTGVDVGAVVGNMEANGVGDFTSSSH